VVGPSPRSGEAEAPPRSRLSPSPGVGRGRVHRPRSRLSPSPGVGRGGDRRSRSRLSPSPRVGRGGVRRPRSRLSPSPGVGRGRVRRPRSRLSPSPGVGQGGVHRPRSRLSPSPGGRARRSFLWRLRPDLAAVTLTMTGGTAVGAAHATLFSCQVSQWRGEMTVVTPALSTEERASG
jgi:hypothetical protein